MDLYTIMNFIILIILVTPFALIGTALMLLTIEAIKILTDDGKGE